MGIRGLRLRKNAKIVTAACPRKPTQCITIMFKPQRKALSALVISLFFLLLLFLSTYPSSNAFVARKSGWRTQPQSYSVYERPNCSSTAPSDGKKFHWSCVPVRYPVSSMKSLPSSTGSGKIPRIQAQPVKETTSERGIRLARLDAVKGNFTHAWAGCKSHAWLRDEVMPLSGRTLDAFGGWAATVVDSLNRGSVVANQVVLFSNKIQILYGSWVYTTDSGLL